MTKGLRNDLKRTLITHQQYLDLAIIRFQSEAALYGFQLFMYQLFAQSRAELRLAAAA